MRPFPARYRYLSDLGTTNRLAKARNEHGKARSEKAALSERVDAERASLASEVARLKEEVHSHGEVDRSHNVEQELLKQTIERLEDEVREGKDRKSVV